MSDGANNSSMAVATAVDLPPMQVQQDQQESSSHPLVLLGGRLELFVEQPLAQLEGSDVFVNFCTPYILAGVDALFEEIHTLAGQELANACDAKYRGMGVGSACMTEPFNATNFKKLVHCIIPSGQKFDELDQFDLSLCYRNALDLTAEAGLQSLVFRHPFLPFDKLPVRIALLTIKKWMDDSPYAPKITKLTIICGVEEVRQLYKEEVERLLQCAQTGDFFPELNDILLSTVGAGVVGAMEGGGPVSVDMQVLEQLLQAEFESAALNAGLISEQQLYAEQQMIDGGNGGNGGGGGGGGGRRQRFYHPAPEHPDYYAQQQQQDDSSLLDEAYAEDGPSTSAAADFCLEQYGFDEAYVRENAAAIYDEMFKTPEGLQLQLSRNLSATILTIEEEDGMLRQYRMTTQNREGDTSYFRCSRCESLMRHTNSEYRPKITVKGGFICGDCYPSHHPQCQAIDKYQVIIQQMDRQARMNLGRNEWEQGQREGKSSNPTAITAGGGGTTNGAQSDSSPNELNSSDPDFKAPIPKRPRRSTAGGSGVAPSSARSRLLAVDGEGGGGGGGLQEGGAVGGGQRHIADVARQVGGNTLEAIRKCEDELNLEGNYVAGGEKEEDGDMEVGASRGGRRTRQSAGGAGAGVQLWPPRRSFRRAAPKGNEAGAHQQDEGGGGGGDDGGHIDVVETDSSPKDISAEGAPDSTTPPQAGSSSAAYRYPTRRRAVAFKPINTVKMASNMVYKIPYPEEAEGYIDTAQEEMPTPVAIAAAATASPIDGSAAPEGKCRKYRIIRRRGRTNEEFDWLKEGAVAGKK